MASEHRHHAPRPGLVLDVDRSTPPILFHHGEGFSLERLPVGRSRVIYPAEPLPGLADPEAAIRDALLRPLDSDPLPSLLRPGMKLTIAFDDVSLPLPPMRRPDIRQRVIEQVLDMAAAAGVDDVHLIAALALHRRMTDGELRHALGERVYDAFAPQGALYNHDAEDPDGMVELGRTDHDELVTMNRRAAESDLLVYVNINLVAMDGGWKSTATGLADYRALRHHHNVHTMQHSRSFMDRPRSELHRSNWRQGEVITANGPRIFQIETTVNNNTFGRDGPLAVLQKREWEWTARGPGLVHGHAGRAEGHAGRGPPGRVRPVAGALRDDLGAGRGGGGGPRAHHRQRAGPAPGAGAGPDRRAHHGAALHLPLQRELGDEPDPGDVPGLGYFFNLYRGKPLVREGGVVIMSHPTRWEFHPVHHPSYIDFFEQLLAETTDPAELEAKYEAQFATDEWYVHLYRTSYAYHGVHPFYMWYWGAHALQWLGRVIVVGGDPRAVRRMGFQAASTLSDALEMATDVVGPSPTVTHLHNPPILMADVE